MKKHSAKSLNIFVADDDKDLLTLIQTILQREGFHTKGFLTGAEIIRHVKNSNPLRRTFRTILLLDYRLPDITGPEIIKILRADNIEVPFIIMTGQEDSSLSSQALELGAINFLIKDRYFIDRLIPIVKQSLYRTGLESKLRESENRQRESTEELNKYRKELVNLHREHIDKMQTSNKMLEREIAERLRIEEEAIRAKHLILLGELAAGVAHEINNPINGIINYTQILANLGSKGTREHDIATRIIKEADRIASIVQSLLSFARSSSEEKHPVSLMAIMADSLALTETQLKKEGIRLNISIPSALPEIIAHPQQIEQVFLNVISNARYALNSKYLNNSRNKVFEISSSKVDYGSRSYVRTSFYDKGCGIPAEVLDKVMNPFFTTKPVGVGTGLGLSISHGIISDHGGSLRIESSEKQYTRVIIDLPAFTKKDLADEI